MQYNYKGGDNKMHTSNKDFSKSNNQNKITSSHKNNISSSSKYENVEPLPESSRPRRDGPGGEDVK